MQIRKPEMFKLAEKGGERKLWKQILIFIVVFFMTQIFIGIVGGFPLAVMQDKEMLASGIDGSNIEATQEIANRIMESREGMYIQLFATLVGSIAVILWTRFNEKRSLRSIGFQRKNALRDYAIGMLVGLVMFSLVVGLNFLTGSMTIETATENLNLTGLRFIAIFFIGFLFQGAFEEILLRGYFMVNIGAKHKTMTALIISSIAFAVMHGANPGISMLALVNLALIGVFFGLYIICFNNIWGACAIHSIWNFVQGHLYGISVSGMKVHESIFLSTSVPGKEFINGGAFGAEGGIATTIVTILSIALLLLYMKKTGCLENNSTKETAKSESIESVETV